MIDETTCTECGHAMDTYEDDFMYSTVCNQCIRDLKAQIDALARLAHKQIKLLDDCEIPEESADEAHALWLFCDDRYTTVDELKKWAMLKVNKESKPCT